MDALSTKIDPHQESTSRDPQNSSIKNKLKAPDLTPIPPIIFNYLSIPDLLRAAQACKAFKACAENAKPWRVLCRKSYLPTKASRSYQALFMTAVRAGNPHALAQLAQPLLLNTDQQIAEATLKAAKMVIYGRTISGYTNTYASLLALSQNPKVSINTVADANLHRALMRYKKLINIISDAEAYAIFHSIAYNPAIDLQFSGQALLLIVQMHLGNRVTAIPHDEIYTLLKQTSQNKKFSEELRLEAILLMAEMRYRKLTRKLGDKEAYQLLLTVIRHKAASPYQRNHANLYLALFCKDQRIQKLSLEQTFDLLFGIGEDYPNTSDEMRSLATYHGAQMRCLKQTNKVDDSWAYSRMAFIISDVNSPSLLQAQALVQRLKMNLEGRSNGMALTEGTSADFIKKLVDNLLTTEPVPLFYDTLNLHRALNRLHHFTADLNDQKAYQLLESISFGSKKPYAPLKTAADIYRAQYVLYRRSEGMADEDASTLLLKIWQDPKVGKHLRKEAFLCLAEMLMWKRTSLLDDAEAYSEVLSSYLKPSSDWRKAREILFLSKMQLQDRGTVNDCQAYNGLSEVIKDARVYQHLRIEAAFYMTQFQLANRISHSPRHSFSLENLKQLNETREIQPHVKEELQVMLSKEKVPS